MGFSQTSEQTLAAASGSSTGLGKVGTILAAGVLIVRLNCDPRVEKVDWQVQANGAHLVQLYRSRTNVMGATITLADATTVDDADPFIFNGLTFIAETTEGDAAASARKYYAPDQPTAAANLAALLANPTYGVPGIGAITVTAPAATDVLTIAGGAAPVYHFAQSTSAADEIAWASTTLAGLVKHGAVSAAKTTTAAYGGDTYEQWVDGWPFAYLSITSTEATNAITPVVKAVRYWG